MRQSINFNVRSSIVLFFLLLFVSCKTNVKSSLSSEEEWQKRMWIDRVARSILFQSSGVDEATMNLSLIHI